MTATKVRTKQPEVRRDQLLDAAESLFATNGQSDTTVADIAEAAGVAKGTFYLYFPSKEHCVVALKERLTEELVDRFMGVLSPSFIALEQGIPINVRSVTESLIDESFAYALEHADTFHNLFHRGDTIEIDQVSLAAEDTITATLTIAFGRLNELGLARITHPEMTANILFSGIHWALEMVLHRKNSRDLTPLKEAAVEVVTRALGTESIPA
jgi:AcrR family transcriptional regulator